MLIPNTNRTKCNSDRDIYNLFVAVIRYIYTTNKQMNIFYRDSRRKNQGIPIAIKLTGSFAPRVLRWYSE